MVCFASSRKHNASPLREIDTVKHIRSVTATPKQTMNGTDVLTLTERVEAVRNALRIDAQCSTHLSRDPRHDEVEIVLRGPRHKLLRLNFEVTS